MTRLLLAASISLMLLSGAAMAAPRHGGDNGHGHGQSAWNDHDGDRGDRRDGDRHDGDRYGDRDDRYEGRHHRHRHHDNGLHLRQYKFARGQRVPVVYLQPRYYVEDYRAYHLAPPPRGYRWVRPADGRYLLVATATGLISQILGY